MAQFPLPPLRGGRRCETLLKSSRNLRHTITRKMAAAQSDPEVKKLEFSLHVPFPSAHLATIALRSLTPDREPRRGGVHKQLTLRDNTLSVRWTADTARILRVSTSSFLDHLILVLETAQMFPSDACGQ